MFWEGESLLHIGWADTVKIARVRPPTADPTDSKRSLQIVASFQMDYLIAVSVSGKTQAADVAAYNASYIP